MTATVAAAPSLACRATCSELCNRRLISRAVLLISSVAAATVCTFTPASSLAALTACTCCDVSSAAVASIWLEPRICALVPATVAPTSRSRPIMSRNVDAITFRLTCRRPYAPS